MLKNSFEKYAKQLKQKNLSQQWNGKRDDNSRVTKKLIKQSKHGREFDRHGIARRRVSKTTRRKRQRERRERYSVRNGGEIMREMRERSHGNTADSATPRPVVDQSLRRSVQRTRLRLALQLIRAFSFLLFLNCFYYLFDCRCNCFLVLVVCLLLVLLCFLNVF